MLGNGLRLVAITTVLFGLASGTRAEERGSNAPIAAAREAIAELPDCNVKEAKRNPSPKDLRRFEADLANYNQRGLDEDRPGQIRTAHRLIRESYELFGFPNNHVAELYFNIGHMHQMEGEPDQMIAPMKCAYKIQLTRKASLGVRMQILNRLAQGYGAAGMVSDAERTFLDAMAIAEREDGPDTPEVTSLLHGLGTVYKNTGLLSEAERMFDRALPLYRRGFEGRPAYLSADASLFSTLLTNFAGIKFLQGRYEDALALSAEAVALLEGYRYGRDHPYLLNSAYRYGAALSALNRHTSAAKVLSQVLGEVQKSRPEQEWFYIRGYVAALCRGTDKATATSFLEYLDGFDDAGREDEHYFIKSYCQYRFEEKAAALESARRAVQAFRRKGQAIRGPYEFGESRPLHYFGFRLDLEDWLLFLLAEKGAKDEDAAEAFLAAQSKGASTVVDALEQLALRNEKAAHGSDVRAVQDLVAKKKHIDGQMSDLFALPSNERDTEREAALRLDLQETAEALEKAGIQPFKNGQPWSSLKRYESVSEIQGDVSRDQAVVVFRYVGDESGERKIVGFALTRDEVRWWPVAMTAPEAERNVAVLRCGLDDAEWIDSSQWPAASPEQKATKEAQARRRERCASLTSSVGRRPDSLPFSLTAAHKLYEAFLAPAGGMIAGKELLFVPSGPLSSIPPHVLVTQAPTEGEISPDSFRHAAWLAKSSATSIIPSVASIRVLASQRVLKGPSVPYMAFADPVVGKQQNTAKHQTCSAKSRLPAPGKGRALRARTVSGLMRAGLADNNALANIEPLPETAEEVCAISSLLGGGLDRVYLGPDATETAIKQLSSEGKLAETEVLHFATHGLKASETHGLSRASEPALLLSPPKVATATDDGLLTASEVARLRLDADWVVLSACNTAAGIDDENAETLSGLARAFFYAGARALLVSHWYVDNLAAVQITTQAFAAYKSEQGMSKAEALRRAVVGVLSAEQPRPKGSPEASHPAVWAPFVLVGGLAASK